MESAVMITRHKDGQVGIVPSKGNPRMMEIAALSFGVFVSMVKTAEAQGVAEMDRVQIGRAHV